ncbi:MAG: ABC transporter ATP-binding protein [Candidatus Limiplasma sp.]|nr:ABC transporter ATP-binding protein [Candidatus Limiplasma sp.]
MRNITKAFPGVVANDDISLQIQKGEILALLGENGAGKSTLMSILFGMYAPDEGEIYVRGRRVSIASPSDAVALEIGMVHQHFQLVQNFTVTENIILGTEPMARAAGVPWVDIKGASKKIRELSRRYGLEVDPDALIENLNVSARQRVEILKMLYREAEILIFDEPTAVLTPQEIDFLLEVIGKLRQGGKTIILITHKLEEIMRIADRCAVLNRGKLVGLLDVKTATMEELVRMMVGRDIALELTKPEASFGKPVLEVRDLTVANADGFEVVKEVSFTVRQGEIFAIAGVAGNGQVEIADAIFGLLPVKRGGIALNGADITRSPVRDRVEQGIAYIPEDRQTYGLILDFTLSDNLSMRKYYKPPFCSRGFLRRDLFDQYAQRLIEAYDIRSGQGARTTIRSMSGGNQQKAIIAREVEQNAPLIIFVQPTRGLDIGAITSIRERMVAERTAGKAVLLISLELDEIMACADTIGVMYNGKLNKCVPADEITMNEIGEYMMGAKQ